MPNQLKQIAISGRRMPNDRRAGEVDAEIGRRIRQARTKRQVTQEDLAGRLGISCQQFQKYENGSNRISVSRLVQMAQHLNADVMELLADDDRSQLDASDDVAGACPTTSVPGASEPTARDVMSLMEAFCGTRNPEARTKILDMARFFFALENK